MQRFSSSVSSQPFQRFATSKRTQSATSVAPSSYKKNSPMDSNEVEKISKVLDYEELRFDQNNRLKELEKTEKVLNDQIILLLSQNEKHVEKIEQLEKRNSKIAPCEKQKPVRHSVFYERTNSAPKLCTVTSDQPTIKLAQVRKTSPLSETKMLPRVSSDQMYNLVMFKGQNNGEMITKEDDVSSQNSNDTMAIWARHEKETRKCISQYTPAGRVFGLTSPSKPDNTNNNNNLHDHLSNYVNTLSVRQSVDVKSKIYQWKPPV